ncbi:MAG: DHH family phosphoesterase [Candidatus Verstraetearchaeota archaeon]|nr:DHH family phosphoesterase [Candidatus Verstraetearchaeota archaeon]
MPDLLKFLSSYRRIAVVCHPNADPDCLGSAYALRTAVRAASPRTEVEIVVPEGINAAASKMVESLRLEFVTSLPTECELAVFVDMPSLDQLPEIKAALHSRRTPYAIIDHHTPEKDSLEGAVFSITTRISSTCEIIYNSIPKKYLDRQSLLALLTGLIYDSRRFLIQPNSSISAAIRIIRRGTDYAAAVEMLLNDQDISERIAKLKGAARVRIYRARDWLFATSRVGSFEASVARSLVDLGADLALVASGDSGPSRVTGRLSERFQKATSLDLAESVMRPLAERFSGTGGGHPSAASAKTAAGEEEALAAALSLVSAALGLSQDELKEVSTQG